MRALGAKGEECVAVQKLWVSQNCGRISRCLAVSPLVLAVMRVSQSRFLRRSSLGLSIFRKAKGLQAVIRSFNCFYS